MKNLLVVFALFFSVTLVYGESPQKVYRITQEYYTNDWYKKQSELWKKEIEKNPQNATAWENYYYANRYARFEDINSKERQAKLARIIEEMGRAIPDSYEYTLLKAWNSHDVDDIPGYEKAYKMNPDRPDPLYNMITHYELHNNVEKAKELYHKLYKARDIMPPLLDYNYNVLMSLEEDAILFTNGDNDTYPARMLQIVKNIRPDVTIINISMGTTEKYLLRKLQEHNYSVNFKELTQKANLEPDESSPEVKKNVLIALVSELTNKYPDIKIYFALTVYDPFKEKFKSNLYITGLAERYASNPLDNVALLKKHIEQNFRLDDVILKWYGEEYVGATLMAQMNLNYIPAFLKLAEHYQIVGETWRANQWANKALVLAKNGGEDELIQFINSKGFHVD
ncbi:hypothetical protein EH223_07840 [candidate division KSB1 bacterium]|nr:hypothetical protein [candidate division KSB1 bacterium]RQW04288.1 MAG: hypothetical protein EH223_07840 [candidate division KSB1 bacterium]